MIDVAEKFLRTLNRSPRTIRTYRWALGKYFEFSGEVLCDEAYEHFLEIIRRYSPSTQMVFKAAVRGLYDFEEIGNPAIRDKLDKHYIKSEGAKPVNVKRDLIENFLRYCEGLNDGIIELRDRAFVFTLADSGFRISELCSLNRGDIDWLEERVLVVGKGNKSAVVRLSNRSISFLHTYLDARAKMDGESGKQLSSLPLFAQHGNIKKIKRISPSGMRKSIKEYIEKSGIAKNEIRIHDFRHYFVTEIVIATGGNLKKAQELARHKNIAITQRYAHYSDNELDQDYDEIFNKR